MSAKQFSIAFTLMGQLGSGFLKAFSAGSKSICNLEKDTREFQRKMAELAPSFSQIQQKADSSTQAYIKQAAHVHKLSDAMAQTKTPSKAMVRTLEQAKNALKSQGEAYKENINNLEKYKSLQEAYSNSKKDILRGRMAENKAGAYATAYAASEAFKNVVSTGMDFEQQMARVGAVANIPTQNLGKLTETAQALGRTTEWSASQAAQGMQYLAMAGFKENQIVQAMPGMLSMATAGHLDLARAADIASNVMSGFGMTADQIGRIGDVMAKTTSSANLNMEQFGETMKYVAPVAKAAGVTLEQAAAMAAKLGNAGIQGSDAGTALRAIFARVATTGAKALKSLGVETKDAAGNMRNYQDIIEDLGRKLNALPSGEKLKYLESIFGKNAMSGGAALIAVDKEFGSLKDFEKVLLKAQGTSDQMAQQQSETLQGRVRAMQSAMEGLKLSVYASVQPAMTGITNFATKAINSINELTEDCPGLGAAFGVVTGGLAAYINAAVPFNNAIQTGKYLISGYKLAMEHFAIAEKLATVKTIIFSGVQKAWAAVTSFCSGAMATLNAIMAANPVGALIVAFAALIAIGILVWKNWDTIKAGMLDFWQTGVMPVINGLMQAWNGILAFINGVFSGNWQKAWEGVKNIFGGVFNALIGLAKMPLNAIIGMINMVIGGINKLGGIEIAGTQLGINIPTIPKLAQGGIVSQPTLAMIGEGRESEAVLPLSELSRMVNGGAGGGDIHVSYTINVDGGGAGNSDIYAQVRRGLDEGSRNLKAELERLMANQRRVSYA